ncbi:hypothetical protein [Catelliglobosispora koreensis]|uniref:hypothetical protein n=1 Tax=Catelliglobosispora koreensis TaxID=129052 RepID=UPI00036525ED|nr:hypothetical protein [Catelliglobosispora koreensis]
MSIDHTQRLALLQDICAREGHGELDEVTTFRTVGLYSEYLCRRGCGTKIIRLDRGMSLPEIEELFEHKRGKGTLYFRRDVITFVPDGD